MEEITVTSPAKINLGLRVLGKRDDGFHEIETIMQMIELSDTIVIKKRDRGIKVSCSDEKLSGKANLAYRAASMIKEEGTETAGADIRIEKNIPVGSGLGGGSSNAASVLLGLNRLWELGYQKERLMEIAGSLGSDVPFFLDGPLALSKGRGEILTPLEKPGKFYIVLVIPSLSISTEWAYKNLNLKLTNRSKESNLQKLNLFETKTKDIQPLLLNDLEEVVKKRLPDIPLIKKRLASLGAIGVSMSGSGSSIYGLFLEQDICLKASDALKREGRDTIVTETMTKRLEFPRS